MLFHSIDTGSSPVKCIIISASWWNGRHVVFRLQILWVQVPPRLTTYYQRAHLEVFIPGSTPGKVHGKEECGHSLGSYPKDGSSILPLTLPVSSIGRAAAF